MTSRLTLPCYLAGMATSLFGNAAITIVLPWLVLERTGDPAAAGLVAALSALPGIPAAFFGGFLVDRLGRKVMAVFADIGSAIAVAALAIVDSLVGLNIGWFIALGVLGALFDVPGMTARESLMADVAQASGTGLDRVGALRGALMGLSTLLGPALAGWLLTFIPSVSIVWLTASCSAVAALTTAVMPLPRRSIASHHDDSVLAGLRYAKRTPGVSRLLLVCFGTAAVSAPLVSVILPAHFNASSQPGLLGLSLSVYAVGTILGAALYGTVFANRRWAAWLTVQLLLAGGAALVAILIGFWPVAVGMVGIGIASGLLGPITSVAVTERIPEGLRGRVLALFAISGTMAAPIGLGIVTTVLTVGPLALGAWTVVGGFVIVAIYSASSAELRHYIEAQEDPDADYQTAS